MEEFTIIRSFDYPKDKLNNLLNLNTTFMKESTVLKKKKEKEELVQKYYNCILELYDILKDGPSTISTRVFTLKYKVSPYLAKALYNLNITIEIIEDNVIKMKWITARTPTIGLAELIANEVSKLNSFLTKSNTKTETNTPETVVKKSKTIKPEINYKWMTVLNPKSFSLFWGLIKFTW